MGVLVKNLLLLAAGALVLVVVARKRAAAARSSSSAGDASQPIINGGVLWNPVAALPALVPYSSKQALLGYAPALAASSADTFTPAGGPDVTVTWVSALPSVANK